MNENTADILKKIKGKLRHANLSQAQLILSIIIGIALSVIVAIVVYFVQIETVNTNKEIERVENQVRDLISKLYAGTLTAGESDRIGYQEGSSYLYLSGHNWGIALAKFNVKTKRYHDDPDTIKESKKPYRTKRRVTTTAILIGVFSPFLTIPFSLLVLFIVTVIWYFVLDRINEISTAIQGKR